MKPYYEDGGVRIFHGDVLDALRAMPDESVNCCVTSPPYWGLRDYGVEGQIGLEATPDLFVTKMVEVFGEVRRVLRPDGTLWLNLGDSYAGSGPSGASYQSKTTRERDGKNSDGAFSISKTLSARGLTYAHKKPVPPVGWKPKDLIGIPWRVAFALQADGWWLRQDIIWHKPNPMPESVTDRCTKSHEYIFLLAKSERYYFNADAIAEPCGGFNGSSFTKGKTADARKHLAAIGKGDRSEPSERNKRDVWTVSTSPFPEAHFATFPEDLIRPCILAGCPPGGTVLEPFCGSGTTLKVARDNGCNGIGIELNEDYIGIALRRLAQNVMNFGATA